MSLFRLDASIRVEGSHSRAIADVVEHEWRNAYPGEPVIRRHVGVDPIPATTWATAVFAGKPAVLVTVRGGNYRPGTPREGWDHATGWMRRILADVWSLDLKVVEADFTLVG